MSKLNLELDKAITNHKKQNEVLEVVLQAMEEYGNKAYNKRFTTFVNKKLIDKFGSDEYERYGNDGKYFETIGKAYTYLTREEFIKKHTKFNFVFESVDIRTNFDDKSHYLGLSREHDILYNSDTLEDLKEALQARISYNAKLIEKLEDNKNNLEELQAEHKAIKSQAEVFNNKLTYVLSKELRI